MDKLIIIVGDFNTPSQYLTEQVDRKLVRI